MNEKELDKARARTYQQVVQFALDAVEKEKAILEEKLRELNRAINDLISMGANFGSSNVRKIEESIRRTEKLLEKTNNDLNYLSGIMTNLQTTLDEYTDFHIDNTGNKVYHAIESTLKADRRKELEDQINDINYVVDDATMNARISILENEINNVNSTYEPQITNEGNYVKRKELVDERNKKLKQLQDRINKIPGYKDLEDSDRQQKIQDLNDRLNDLMARPVMSYEDQLENAIIATKPLFTKYTNNYGGQDVTVKEYNGETTFKYIMKSTDTYAKLGAKVDKMDTNLQAINRDRKANGKVVYDTHQHSKLLIRSSNQTLPYRLREVRKKQIAIESGQRIVMLKRQEVIDKKNAKISKLEGKAAQLRQDANRRTANNAITRKIEAVNSYRKRFKAWRTEVRVSVLKKKPIFLTTPRGIFITEQIKDAFLRKSTDKNGNMDYRSWQERALERMEEKNEKKGRKF